MAVPKRKTSPAKRGMRRSHDALKKPTYVEDKGSGELRGRTHRPENRHVSGPPNPEGQDRGLMALEATPCF